MRLQYGWTDSITRYFYSPVGGLVVAKTAKKKGTAKKTESKPIWSIDKDNLDAECILQPKLVAEYADQLPDARAELDRAEARLKVVAAEMDAKIRRRPAKYDLEKATEAAIKTTIPGTDEYQAAEKEVREAKHHLDTLTAALEVLRARKSSLEFLVGLHSMSYFSTPSRK